MVAAPAFHAAGPRLGAGKKLSIKFVEDDLALPFRKVAECRNGKPSFVAEPVPEWLRALL
jgi:hypothetical protein